MRKSKHIFKSSRHDKLTIKLIQIALSSNVDKIMQKLDSRKIFTYGISKEIINKTDKINSWEILKKY